LVAGLVFGFGTLVAAGVQEPSDQGRESWQRVPDIFAAMGLSPGAVVADIGAGDGFFTTRLAKGVGPDGRVVAVDISDSALARLRRRLEADRIGNVTITLGTPTDPKLPAGTLDAALIVNAYHEMTQFNSMLTAIRTALKPSGRLVIVEPISAALRGASREQQTDRHQIGPRFVQREALEAGFLVRSLEDPFTERHGHGDEFLVVLVPDRAAPSRELEDGSRSVSTGPGSPQPGLTWESPEIRVSAVDTARLMAAGRALVLDVRDAAMYVRGHLPGARLAPPESWRSMTPALQAETREVITCCS
jgi:predicted methyltransferase